MKTIDKEKLLREIRDSRVEIASINDLLKINNKYNDLVPILLRHLQEIDDENDKEFIVRCLGVRGFSEASKPLICEFYKSKNITFKWAIGNTLSIIRDKDVLPDLLRIVKENEHGIARQMIVIYLGVFKKDENIKNILIELLNDDDVAGQAIMAIRKIGDVELVKHVEPLIEHEKTWIRNEAKKTIDKFSKVKILE